jgi:guanylate kinase
MKPEFESLRDDNKFIEHAVFGGNMYGTSFKAVEDVSKSGRVCILDIEMEGVKQLHKSHILARYLFLSPPSFEELENRLRGRATDTEAAIQKRLAQAKLEMEYSSEPGVHDKIVVNDDLNKAYKEVEAFCLEEVKKP